MSGNYTFLLVDPAGLGNDSVYSLDLSKSFNVDTTIDTADFQSSLVPTVLTPNIGLQLQGTGGSFFYDKTALYPYSGFAELTNDESNNIIAAYNTTTSQWSSLPPVSGGNLQFGNRDGGQSVSVPDLSLSFFLGGDSKTPIPGLVKFDSSNPSAPKWYNQTAGNVPSILSGAMVYVPVGTQGALLAFGGYNSTRRVTTEQRWEFNPFDRISVYDIASSIWRTVVATGDVPSNRTDFCAAMSTSPDYSSFQITLYGGWSVPNGRSYDDVYVLAVPSFLWTKVSDQHNNETSTPDPIGRRKHKCEMWKDSQMVVIGGIVSNGSSQINAQPNCDRYPPVRVLDTSTYTWQTEFQPSKAYSVPEAISAVIGGNGTGGAKLNAPKEGWPSPELQTLFSKVIRAPATNLTTSPTGQNSSFPSASNNSSTNNDPNNSSTSTSNVGAIAGGVLGGLAVLAIVLGLILFLLHRRKRQSKAGKHPTPMADEQKYELTSAQVTAELGNGQHVGNGHAELSGNYHPVEIGSGSRTRAENEASTHASK
ncbi:MAG: hypothetical protein M1829_000239 [Trizodia sp. TS-e1964]|nr:MAG: hypothetical protein M1829_000239 [Trizodia sp. TS-e1964]